MSLQTGIRTFEVIVAVTGFLEGCIDDWPPQIQDEIFKALERKAHEVELPLTIIHSRCEVDYADEAGKNDTFNLHVIASEIVAKDVKLAERAINEHKSVKVH